MRTALIRRLRPCCAIALVVSAAALIVGCAKPSSEPRPSPNVLLITIDTLRADALGAYGNRSVSTPWIDRLAAGGVRFTQARASAVVTLPSHATILSGLYPFHHGVRENAGFRFSPQLDTLATLLRARQYRTGTRRTAPSTTPRSCRARRCVKKGTFDVRNRTTVPRSVPPAASRCANAGPFA